MENKKSNLRKNEYPISDIRYSARSGQLAIEVIFFSTIAVILLSGFIFLAGGFLQLSSRAFNRAQALGIAEAGIEYYRWHLAHAPVDYWDGHPSSTPGPYIHQYYDKDGGNIGQFSLEVTPPPKNSTLVTIKSTATVFADTSITKIIEAKLALPTLAKYAFAINGNIMIGTGTEVFGPFIANGGVHFDGLAHDVVMSTRSSYDDPSHGGQNEYGVHTHVSPLDPLPPAAVLSRPDVFMVGRRFPVPAVNFNGITATLQLVKTSAQNGGVYATSSGAYGYDLVFNASGTYSLYKVTQLANPPNGCNNFSQQPDWGSWSIQAETPVRSGPIPANTAFFFEDNVWVSGQISGKRVAVGAGVFPVNSATYKNIIINNDLRYTTYDGADAFSLIAQNSIYIGLVSADILRIDGALIAQNGRIARFYYQPPNFQSNANHCAPYDVRQKITVYGALASNQPYELGFNDGTGYQERIIIFDPNLESNPPPNSPLLGNNFVQVSWKELQ